MASAKLDDDFHQFDEDDEEEEFEEAVSQALRWFDVRCAYNRKKAARNKGNGRNSGGVGNHRLLLDFQHLVIGNGIDVEALSQRIRDKVAPIKQHTPIHLSLKSCRVQDDGGLEVMRRFLRNVPNLTLINVTWLWFDYLEISNVVSAATELKELELPLGNQRRGVSQVLQACQQSRQLSDIRFFCSGSYLEGDLVEEVMDELPLLKHLKALSLSSFKCNDECFATLVTHLLSLDLDELHLSCDGGITSVSLPLYAKILRGLPSSTNLSLRMRNVPGLFYDASNAQIKYFCRALEESPCLAWLEMDHVGLTGPSTSRVLRALESLQRSSVVVVLCGPGLLQGKPALPQLLKSLPRMHSLHRLAVIDTHFTLNEIVGGPRPQQQPQEQEQGQVQAQQGEEQQGEVPQDEEEQQEEEAQEQPAEPPRQLLFDESLICKAVFPNPCLQNLSLRAAGDCVYPLMLDDIFQRNATLALVHDTITSAVATPPQQFPLALWAPALAQVSVKGGRFGADPIFHLLQHFAHTV